MSGAHLSLPDMVDFVESSDVGEEPTVGDIRSHGLAVFDALCPVVGPVTHAPWETTDKKETSLCIEKEKHFAYDLFLPNSPGMSS